VPEGLRGGWHTTIIRRRPGEEVKVRSRERNATIWERQTVTVNPDTSRADIDWNVYVAHNVR